MDSALRILRSPLYVESGYYSAPFPFVFHVADNLECIESGKS